MEMDAQSETIKSRFARVYGSAGEAPRVMGILKAFWPLSDLLIIGLSDPGGTSVSLSVSFSIRMGSYFIGSDRRFLLAMGDRRLGNYLKGAKGEEWVARELAFLPATFTVFNGIRVPDGQYNLIIFCSGLLVFLLLKRKIGVVMLSFQRPSSSRRKRS